LSLRFIPTAVCWFVPIFGIACWSWSLHLHILNMLLLMRVFWNFSRIHSSWRTLAFVGFICFRFIYFLAQSLLFYLAFYFWVSTQIRLVIGSAGFYILHVIFRCIW